MAVSVSSSSTASPVVLQSGWDSSEAPAPLQLPAKAVRMVGSRLASIVEFFTPGFGPLLRSTYEPDEFTLGQPALLKPDAKRATAEAAPETSIDSRDSKERCNSDFDVPQSLSSSSATSEAHALSVSQASFSRNLIGRIPTGTWDIAARLASAVQQDEVSLGGVAAALREMLGKQSDNEALKNVMTCPVDEAGTLEPAMLSKARAGSVIVRGKPDSDGKREVILVPADSLMGYKIIPGAGIESCPEVAHIHLERGDIVVLVVSERTIALL